LFDEKDLFLRPDLMPKGRRAQRQSRIYREAARRMRVLDGREHGGKITQVEGLRCRNDGNGCYGFSDLFRNVFGSFLGEAGGADH
jgi:hypothetical protein